MRTKLLSLVLALMMAVALLAGCGGSAEGEDAPAAEDGSEAAATEAGGEGIQLEMWVYSDWATGATGEMFQKWADDFAAQDEEVAGITLIGKADSDLKAGLMAGVGLPDCFTASFRDGKTYVESMDYMNLKPYFDEQDEEYKTGFNTNAMENVTEGDQMYALPYVGYCPVFFRNLDVLEQAGIDPAEGIPTWDAFVEQCQKVKDAGIDPTHSFAGDWFTAGAILGSEESLTVGKDDAGKTTVTAEELLPTMEMLTRLKEVSNNMQQADEATGEAFKTGELAFMLDGPWSVEGFNTAGVNYDIVCLPAFEEGGRTGGLRGLDAVYALEGDHNDAVFRWIKYMTDYDRMHEFTLSIGRTVLRDDVMQAEDVQADETAKVFAEALQGGIDQTDFFRTSVFWVNPITDISVLVDNGSVTPQEGAEQMIEQINALYSEE